MFGWNLGGNRNLRNSITLADLFAEIPIRAGLPPAAASIAVVDLDYDSRKVNPGTVFWAFPGKNLDGQQFASQAVERGAVAVVSENPRPEGWAAAPWLEVEHGRRSLALAARKLYDFPDRALLLTGVTGTNGKTTSVFAIDSMLRALGLTTGMVGTIEYRVADQVRPAINTTPESLDLIRLFADLRQAGGAHCTMEVSSHALELGRVYGLNWHTTVFTNLTRDHLDFHGTMEAYFKAKHFLFEGAGGPPPRFAIINQDDEWGRRISTAGATTRLTYGRHSNADLYASDIKVGFEGLRFQLRHPGGSLEIRSPLTALINVYNLLAAFGTGLSFGFEPEKIAQGLEQCRAVPGRFEKVDEGQPFLVVVDYAHTDDALRNTIAAARALGPKRIITLFGCGGDRDRTKRPLMGQAAAEGSDIVFVTSDNPRSEDPLAIINDAVVGVRRTEVRNFVEPDREKAIGLAIDEAHSGDIVILAGKGHETYQILKDRTIAFDDREVARAKLRSYGYQKRTES